MKLISIDRTCIACPSQWECVLEDGRMIYGRYRGGYLSISISPNPTKDIFDAVGGVELHFSAIGGGYDGCMSDEEFLLHLSKLGIDVTECQEVSK